MSTQTITTCDIDGCRAEVQHRAKTISVAFTTEQTEGRSVPPYLEGVKFDFCIEHYKRYISELPIIAEGAMGFNTFKFKETKEKI